MKIEDVTWATCLLHPFTVARLVSDYWQSVLHWHSQINETHRQLLETHNKLVERANALQAEVVVLRGMRGHAIDRRLQN